MDNERDIALVQAGLSAAAEACKQLGYDHGSAFALHECQAVIANIDPAAIAATVPEQATRSAPAGSGEAVRTMWRMDKKSIQLLAAELIRGAECMGDDETEFVLEVRAAGTVKDDDDNLNAGPILAISDGEYPEEGVYPIDPHNPTAGREPEPASPPDGEAVACKFFAYEPDNGFETYNTKAEAKQAAQDSIDSYREDAADGWPDEVENVYWGVVLGTTKQVPVPDDGYDGSHGVADSGPFVDYVLTEHVSPAPVNQLVEAIEKVSAEWARQKSLFSDLSKDGWMDLAIAELKAALAAAGKE